MKSISLAAAVVAAFAVSATLLAAEEPRTFIDTLDMSSPESTVTTFVDAYQRSDYFTVHYLLSPKAMQGFRVIFAQTFSFSTLFPKVDGIDLPGSSFIDKTASDDARDTVLYDVALNFDDVMWAADRAGLLAFTLGPDAAVTEIETTGNTALAQIATDGEPAEIAVEMRLLDIGDWKIERITWDGSSPTLQPWGVTP